MAKQTPKAATMPVLINNPESIDIGTMYIWATATGIVLPKNSYSENFRYCIANDVI